MFGAVRDDLVICLQRLVHLRGEGVKRSEKKIKRQKTIQQFASAVFSSFLLFLFVLFPCMSVFLSLFVSDDIAEQRRVRHCDCSTKKKRRHRRPDFFFPFCRFVFFAFFFSHGIRGQSAWTRAAGPRMSPRTPSTRHSTRTSRERRRSTSTERGKTTPSSLYRILPSIRIGPYKHVNVVMLPQMSVESDRAKKKKKEREKRR